MRKTVIIFSAALIFLFLSAASAGGGKTVYITFDDGPTLNTKTILEILDRHDAKATFFLLGGRIDEYPEEVRLIHAGGHAIGLHGTSHDAGKIYSSPAAPLSEMNEANDSLYALMGFRSHLCRTPYGSLPRMTDEQYKILCAANFKVWDWTVDPRDGVGAAPSVESIMQRMIKGLRTADPKVILLHDRKSTLRALPEILSYLKSEGYTFLTLDETMAPVNFISRYK